MARPNGFTIIEVTVALVVGSIVLVAAYTMLSNLSDREHTLVAAAIVADGAANGKQELRALVGRLEVGTPGSTSFTGESEDARFASWCDVPSGWQERCNVELAFDTAGGHATLVARIGARPIVLLAGFDRGAFRYLQSASGGGQWIEQWGTGVTAPLGIGALLRYADRTDTLILRIGPRG
ncbi:MAG: PulJ/GspJ family protein [Gemmatimonadaceae bacterium]